MSGGGTKSLLLSLTVKDTNGLTTTTNIVVVSVSPSPPACSGGDPDAAGGDGEERDVLETHPVAWRARAWVLRGEEGVEGG